MEPRDASLEEVRHLVAERQRYDGWLAALEERRADTPTRVFARVQEDYRGRRAEVLGRLQAHVGGLQHAVQALAEQVARLDATAAAVEDERIEAHLRTMVGELDTRRWEALQQELEGRLAQMADERAGANARHVEARELLALAVGEPARGRLGGAVTAPTVVPPAPPIPPAPLPPPPLAPLSPLSDTLGGSGTAPVTDEEVDRALASLDDVLQAPAAPPRLPVDEPALFDPVPHQPVPFDGASGFGTAAERSAAEPVEEPVEAPVEAPAEAAPFDDLAFVRSLVDQGPPDARKTLRCAECGTMNLPTEWYCERCGGELAAE